MIPASPLSGTDWETRYAATESLFGDQPSPLLTRHAGYLRPGLHALAIGDGEGRNGVWLAAQGLRVLALDLSTTALRRARARARAAGVLARYQTRCQDVLSWNRVGPQTAQDTARNPQAFDVITLIFVHLPPEKRRCLHHLVRRLLRPGGLLFLEAFHQDQRERGSGGPSDPDLLYTEALLRRDFAGLQVLQLEKTTTEVILGGEHRGEGVVVHFAARSETTPI